MSRPRWQDVYKSRDNGYILPDVMQRFAAVSVYKESLQTLQNRADMMVVSATPAEALHRDFEKALPKIPPWQ